MWAERQVADHKVEALGDVVETTTEDDNEHGCAPIPERFSIVFDGESMLSIRQDRDEKVGQDFQDDRAEPEGDLHDLSGTVWVIADDDECCHITSDGNQDGAALDIERRSPLRRLFCHCVSYRDR